MAPPGPMISRVSSGRRRRSFGSRATSYGRRAIISQIKRDAFGRFASTGSARSRRQAARIVGRRARYLGKRGVGRFASVSGGSRRHQARVIGRRVRYTANRTRALGGRNSYRRAKFVRATDRHLRAKGFSLSSVARGRRMAGRKWTPDPALAGRTRRTSARMAMSSGGASALRFGKRYGSRGYKASVKRSRSGYIKAVKIGRSGYGFGRASAGKAYKRSRSALSGRRSRARTDPLGAATRKGIRRAERARRKANGGITRRVRNRAASNYRRNSRARSIGRSVYREHRAAGVPRRAARKVSRLERNYAAGRIRMAGLVKGGKRVKRSQRAAQAVKNVRKARDGAPLPAFPRLSPPQRRSKRRRR